ncbi:MAG: hypothetical protein V1709_05010 [Planctomycetota bacterium]
MHNAIFSWVGGGLALVLLYILVSNTLWLLFGSRLLQYLPGVDIKGITGTFKIATMLVLSALGTSVWVFKHIYLSLIGEKVKLGFKDEVGKMIQRGARIVESRRRINNR